jgi:phage tail-like protein
VQDANGTRFHLLLGRFDWQRAHTPDGDPAFPPEDASPAIARRVQWDDARAEVTLWKDTFRFPAPKSAARLSIDARRGSAADQFGNWYWIAEDRQSIRVWSTGSQKTTTFWPTDACDKPAAPADSGFRACPPVQPPPPATLQGLAITEDHYLVVGTLASGRAQPGLLLFDLYSGGPPRHRAWPVAFEPFDLDARTGGGVWVLDRGQHRIWELDRRFDIVTAPKPDATSEPPVFTNADGSPASRSVVPAPIRLDDAPLVPAIEPIAVAAFPIGGVLVLDRNGGDGFARVYWLNDRRVRGIPASTIVMTERIASNDGLAPFSLVAHDFAVRARLADDPSDWVARLFVVAQDGNQAYAFGVSVRGDQLSLHALTDYYPMRLFGGRALVSSSGNAWYDCGETWVTLVAQDRPRYAEDGEIWSPIFDSGLPACVWHRLMLDACIPHGAAVEVWTRASDEWREIMLHEWLSEPERRALGAPPQPASSDPSSTNELIEWQLEPSPRLRPNGSELPYLPETTGANRGTWELLLQRAQGRYLQVKLVLRGDGRSTPRIRALRIWYPRFSYLERYLPAIYRDDKPSADFIDRFLANFEGTFTTIEDRIAAAQMLFDVDTAPAAAIDWLGQWFGVVFDPSWDEQRRRLLLRHAPAFFAARGTIRGLQLALRLTLDDCVDDTLFTDGSNKARGSAGVRIVEKFRTRRTPRALVGDVTTAVPGPQLIDPGAKWQPTSGAEELDRRYRDTFGLAPDAKFPLTAAGVPDGWSDFAQQTLGFIPAASAVELSKWQVFLRRRYGTVGSVPSSYGSPTSFDSIRLPDDQPSSTETSSDWTAFIQSVPTRTRQWWQDFLARRYRTIAALNSAWRTHWSSFQAIPLPDHVPTVIAALSDWFQFEGTALAMQRTAHRFTVLLPIPKNLRADTPKQQRRLALARSVVDLEKPAHTAFDLRFYWAMFRLGEARLGDDTLIDLGSRSPELMGPMVLGHGYLGEAFLSAPAGRDVPDRLSIGRDRLGRSTRLGGP